MVDQTELDLNASDERIETLLAALNEEIAKRTDTSSPLSGIAVVTGGSRLHGFASTVPSAGRASFHALAAQVHAYLDRDGDMHGTFDRAYEQQVIRILATLMVDWDQQKKLRASGVTSTKPSNH